MVWIPGPAWCLAKGGGVWEKTGTHNNNNNSNHSNNDNNNKQVNNNSSNSTGKGGSGKRLGTH